MSTMSVENQKRFSDLSTHDYVIAPSPLYINANIGEKSIVTESTVAKCFRKQISSPSKELSSITFKDSLSASSTLHPYVSANMQLRLTPKLKGSYMVGDTSHLYEDKQYESVKEVVDDYSNFNWLALRPFTFLNLLNNINVKLNNCDTITRPSSYSNFLSSIPYLIDNDKYSNSKSLLPDLTNSYKRFTNETTFVPDRPLNGTSRFPIPVDKSKSPFFDATLGSDGFNSRQFCPQIEIDDKNKKPVFVFDLSEALPLSALSGSHLGNQQGLFGVNQLEVNLSLSESQLHKMISTNVYANIAAGSLSPENLDGFSISLTEHPVLNITTFTPKDWVIKHNMITPAIAKPYILPYKKIESIVTHNLNQLTQTINVATNGAITTQGPPLKFNFNMSGSYANVPEKMYIAVTKTNSFTDTTYPDFVKKSLCSRAPGLRAKKLTLTFASDSSLSEMNEKQLVEMNVENAVQISYENQLYDAGSATLICIDFTKDVSNGSAHIVNQGITGTVKVDLECEQLETRDINNTKVTGYEYQCEVFVENTSLLVYENEQFSINKFMSMDLLSDITNSLIAGENYYVPSNSTAVGGFFFNDVLKIGKSILKHAPSVFKGLRKGFQSGVSAYKEDMKKGSGLTPAVSGGLMGAARKRTTSKKKGGAVSTDWSSI